MQEVCLGKDVSLKALPFASKRELKDKNLTFEWSKKDPEIDEDEHKLEFKAASLKDHFKGFISCEISKNQKPFFTVYHCLKESVGENNVRACVQIVCTLLCVYCTLYLNCYRRHLQL